MSTLSDTEAAPDQTVGFSGEDYQGPRTLNVKTDGGTVSITVGLITTLSVPVTTVTHSPDEGWHVEHDDGVIRFARDTPEAATPGTGAWQDTPLLPRTDTREFITDADRELVIVVQSALCHDAGTGESRVGLATYYLWCEYPSDPLGSLRRGEVVYAQVDVPVPCDVEAAMVLTEFDPAGLAWGGGESPAAVQPAGSDWIADHWPESLLDRD